VSYDLENLIIISFIGIFILIFLILIIRDKKEHRNLVIQILLISTLIFINSFIRFPIFNFIILTILIALFCYILVALKPYVIVEKDKDSFLILDKMKNENNKNSNSSNENGIKGGD